MKYFYITNHAEQTASELPFHPSKGESEGFVCPPHKTKDAHRKWCAKPTTEHRFFSAVEPVNPARRCNLENPPQTLHGWVADYDCRPDLEKLEDALSKILGGAPAPTWASETFSGFLRLVWEFERPIRIPEGAAKDFYKELGVRFRATKLASGFDSGCYEGTRYYELGSNWRRIGDTVPYEVLTGALFKSFQPQRETEVAIPFEDVATAVTERFGDRLSEDFEIGARVPLFWIDDGVDRIGAVVKEEGVIAYSDRADSVWNDWASILGRDWVKQYEDSKIAGSVDNVYTDGKVYWLVEPDRVIDESRENFILRLRQMGFSTAKRKGQPLSEVEKVILFVNTTRRVDGVGPFIFRDDTVVSIDGRNVLNSSRNRPVEPALTGAPDQFPFIHKFLGNLFGPTEVAPGCTQHDLFLAWLQRFYLAAYRKRKLSGHCLILSGPTGRGKTLLSKRIVGGLVGGSEDAQQYLTGQTNFNKNLTEAPLWTVDDTSSASDWRQNRKMTDLIKRSVANPFIEAHAKHRDAMEVEWNGRLMISLNEDASSLSIVPQQDSSNRDKVIGLRLREDAPQDFPDNDTLEAMIERELPFFAHWLLAWRAPDGLMGNARYGVDAWFHPHLRDAARDNSPTQAVMETLDLFAKLHRETNGPIWTGTSAELMGAMGNYTEIKAHGGSFEQQRLARDLQQAAENCLDNPAIRPITCMSTGGGKVWVVNLEESYDLGKDAADA